MTITHVIIIHLMPHLLLGSGLVIWSVLGSVHGVGMAALGFTLKMHIILIIIKYTLYLAYLSFQFKHNDFT